MAIKFDGPVLKLDRSDINTDEIIPAKYLTELDKAALKPHTLEDLELEGFNQKEHLEPAAVIVAGENFGCGSSREHAPWALEQWDINAVVAPSFARIFKQNMFNNGMLAVEIAGDTYRSIINLQGSINASIDFRRGTAVFDNGTDKVEAAFSLTDFERELVEAGGWGNYADSRY